VKIWLSDELGRGFLGAGRYRLLREISHQGSLQKAASELGISYRKAWGDIRAMEGKLGFEIVHRQRGGTGGGTSVLTDKGRELLEAFGRIQSKIQNQAKKIFNLELKNAKLNYSK